MTRVYFLLFALITATYSFCQSSDTIEYSIVNSGNIKGFDKYWKNSDGSIGEWYQFNDRGRGDSMRIVFREDEQGFPTYLSASGKDYMKNDVFEEFNLSNGLAKWKNNAEDEQLQVKEKLFYSGLKANGGHLIKALKANGNKLKMLPYGEVHLTELEKHVISGGPAPKTVWLVEVDGFGLTPAYNWIDENSIDFGSVSEWNSSILKGFEKNVDELLSIQKKYENSFFNKLASTIPQQTNKDILITGVSIFDAVNARVLPNKDVLIHNGVIQKIRDSKSDIRIPKPRDENRKNLESDKYLVIDGKGKTILPGLWDMHVHFADNTDGILHMAAGVTHVRDMGNSEILLDRIKQISEGKIIGPRVEVMSGFIDGAGPFAAPTGVLINNVEEGIKAIRNYAAKGYQQIKLYSSIKPEWVKPLIDEAKQHHLRVAGHIPAFMTATQAINAGYNEVTHMNMLVLNFFGDTVDTRSPLRFSLPAQKAVTLDLHGQEMNQFIQLLKQKDITVDPTLTAFEDMFTSRNKEVSEKFKLTVDHFPLQLQRNIRAGGGGLPVPGGMDDVYKKSFDVFLQITKLLYDSGIRIVPGTDGLAGFDLHRELELYVKAGIPPNKVLQLATYGTANYTGKGKEFGSIEEGKLADLVMVEGNPVEDITNLHRTKLIITQGKIYDPAKLYRAISITPFQ